MADPLAIPVYYDFASSLCYVAHRVMERMGDELDALGISLVWTPIDLVRITGWRRGDPIDGARRENALRVSRELGVALRMPERWMDSRRAQAVALSLRGGPNEAAWRERVWPAVYEDGRNLDDATWLDALGEELGVDLAAATGARGLDALATETALAAEVEVSGVPTFLLDGWPIGGIQEERTMLSLLGRYAARHRRVH
jgi:predicted DsbA family dithiol-disulfide isomerase